MFEEPLTFSDVSDNKLHKVNFLIDLPRRQLTIKLDKKTATVDLTNVPSKLAEVNASFYVGGNLGGRRPYQLFLANIQRSFFRT